MQKRILPHSPLSIIKLITVSIKSYFTIFPCIIGMVILSSVGHLAIAPIFLQNSAFGSIAAIGFVFFTWFLFTAIFAKTNAILSGDKMTTSGALQLAKRRYLWVLGSNIIFFGIGLIMLLLIYTMNLLFDLVNLHPIFLILSAILSIIIFTYLYFAVPEIALTNVAILKGFENSIRLVRYHWWRTFIVLALVGLAILGLEALGILFTGKSRLFFFSGYQCLAQIVLYPLIMSVTSVLLNDLKLRNQH